MKTPKPKIYLSLIIPAYNEERKIAKDIEEATKFFKYSNIEAEIIVSTDGVTDKTNQIIKSLRKKYKNLVLIAKKERIGKGAAIREGVKIASGKIIIFADAGLCVPYGNTKRGLKLLEHGADLAIGSRAMPKSKILISQPLYRRIGSILFSAIIHTLLGIPKNIKDTQCGFKLFNAPAAKKLFHITQSNKFMLDIEILLLAKRFNYKVANFPVTWSNDTDTKFNPIIGSLDNIKELFDIKIRRKL